MEQFELEIGEGKTIMVEVAKDSESRKVGLSGREKIENGMLFVFPYPGKHQMWMKNTKRALDILFMNGSGEITEKVIGDPEHIELLGSKPDTLYVLELPMGFASALEIEVGDILPIPEEHKKADDAGTPPAAKMLDDQGNPQMDIYGGERVFSRPSTKKIVETALEAADEEDFLRLGKLVAKEIKAQDTRGPEYVDPDKTKHQYAEKGSKLEPVKLEKPEKTPIEKLDGPVDTVVVEEKKPCILVNGCEIPVDELKLILRHQGYVMVCKKGLSELLSS